MYCKNKSKLNKQERRSLEKELNVKLAKRDRKKFKRPYQSFRNKTKNNL